MGWSILQRRERSTNARNLGKVGQWKCLTKSGSMVRQFLRKPRRPKESRGTCPNTGFGACVLEVRKTGADSALNSWSRATNALWGIAGDEERRNVDGGDDEAKKGNRREDWDKRRPNWEKAEGGGVTRERAWREGKGGTRRNKEGRARVVLSKWIIADNHY